MADDRQAEALHAAERELSDQRSASVTASGLMTPRRGSRRRRGDLFEPLVATSSRPRSQAGTSTDFMLAQAAGPDDRARHRRSPPVDGGRTRELRDELGATWRVGPFDPNDPVATPEGLTGGFRKQRQTSRARRRQVEPNGVPSQASDVLPRRSLRPAVTFAVEYEPGAGARPPAPRSDSCERRPSASRSACRTSSSGPCRSAAVGRS